MAGSVLLQRVRGFFAAPTARGVQWAAMAAAAIIIVQSAAITGVIVKGAGENYQTASGQAADLGDGFSALVVFAEDAKASAIAQLLREFDASIVDGPKPGGVYKIRLRSTDRSQSAQDSLMRRMRDRHDIVSTVLPSRE